MRFAVVAGAAALAFALSAPPARTEPFATCTKAQKTKRVKALNQFKRQMPAKRRAYFKTHRKKKARRAFNKRQQAKLKTLQRAARCRVRVTAPKSEADLALTMSAAGTSTVTLTTVVQNRGPRAAADVAVTNTLGPGLEFVSAAATNGSCFSGAAVRCEVGSLASTATVTVTTRARRYRAGTTVSSAAVESATVDPNGTNNAANAEAVWPLPPSSAGPPCSPNLTFPGPRAYFHLGPTNYDHYLPAAGTQSTLVLFVDFPDAPQTGPTEPNFAALAPAAQWYSEDSYGRFTLAVTPLQMWLRMPKSSGDYDLDYRNEYAGIVARYKAFLADAVGIADPLVDFSHYSIVYVVGSPGTAFHRAAGIPFSTGTGVVADGKELRGTVVSANEVARWQIFVHETGHLFGLPDLYDFSVPYEEGTRYLGRWEPMSRAGSTSHFLAWVKWKLGWLDPSQLRCLGSSGSLEETLSPIEASGGVKMVVLPTSATTAEVIEVHTLRGASSQICDSGVILYSVDVQAPSGMAAARLKPAQGDVDAASVTSCGPTHRAAYDLGSGEVSTYEDATLRLEVLVTDGVSYNVRVTRK